MEWAQKNAARPMAAALLQFVCRGGGLFCAITGALRKEGFVNQTLLTRCN